MNVGSKAGDSSPDCCKINESSYHYHVKDGYIHPTGVSHKIYDKASL